MNLKHLLLASVASALLPFHAVAGTATVTIENVVAGKTPRYIGFSQGHYYPGGNTSAWIKRSQANCFRIWAAPAYYEPTDDAAPYGDGVTNQATFDARRLALRANPESLTYINWTYFNDKFQNTVQTGTNRCTLNYMASELQALNVETMVVLNRSGWLDENNWAEKWEHWQYYYALSYHLAKNYNISMFEPFNEPDHTDAADLPSEILYIRWTRFASDAIKSAIADVNTRYGKNLQPQILAPTITHSASSTGPYNMDPDPDADPRDDAWGWGQKALAFIDTDMNGNPGNPDMFNVYATHKYNSDAGEYYDEMAMIKNRMDLYHPTRKILPVFYSEFNRYSSSNWMTAPYANTSLSTPDVYTELALSMSKAMLQGVYGMTTFKFSNTYSDTYGFQKTGHHFVFDAVPYDIGGTKKGMEVMRMFAKGFKGERDRYKTTTSSSVGGYNAYTAYDATKGNYYILAINTHDTENYAATFDMNGMGIYTDTVISIEELSGAYQMEVLDTFKMPSTKVFTKTQPSETVWLITVPKGPVLTEAKITAIADAQVQGGTSANINFGTDTSMRVKRGSTADVNRASYLKFNLTGVPIGTPIKRAILRVTGRNGQDTADFSFHVYGDTNDTWAENTIKWNNAPDLHATASKMINVGTGAWPLGDLTVNGTTKIGRADVTDWVRDQRADGTATFVLIREYRYDGDTGDDSRHALLSTREVTTASDRPFLELYY